MRPPPPFPPPPERPRSSTTATVFWVLAWLSAAAAVPGVVYAVLAAAPSNRVGNPMGDVAMAMGIGLAGLGLGGALLFGLFAWWHGPRGGIG